MRVLLQKVNHANVKINDIIYNEILKGFVLFVGFSIYDDKEVIDKMIDKIINLRILEDENNKTNLSIMSEKLEILSISQFTLYADSKKGRRPSFTKSAKSDVASELYDYFNEKLNNHIKVKSGIFQADMKVSLENDGPFTMILDSEEYGWTK